MATYKHVTELYEPEYGERLAFTGIISWVERCRYGYSQTVFHEITLVTDHGTIIVHDVDNGDGLFTTLDSMANAGTFHCYIGKYPYVKSVLSNPADPSTAWPRILQPDPSHAPQQLGPHHAPAPRDEKIEALLEAERERRRIRASLPPCKAVVKSTGKPCTDKASPDSEYGFCFTRHFCREMEVKQKELRDAGACGLIEASRCPPCPNPRKHGSRLCQWHSAKYEIPGKCGEPTSKDRPCIADPIPGTPYCSVHQRQASEAGPSPRRRRRYAWRPQGNRLGAYPAPVRGVAQPPPG